MIDVFKEELLTFKAAAELPIFRRWNGRPAHISRIHSYHRSGIKGPNGDRVRLEAVRTPSGWRTSKQAIARWLSELTTGDPAPIEAVSDQHDRAEAELQAAGF